MDYQLNGIVLKLNTHHLEETISFYTQILGFKLTGQFQDHIFLSKGEHSLMFLEIKESDSKEVQLSGSIYFYSPEVAKIYAEIKNKVIISYPLEDFAYGMREFGLYDNNGYLLQFGTAINR